MLWITICEGRDPVRISEDKMFKQRSTTQSTHLRYRSVLQFFEFLEIIFKLNVGLGGSVVY